VSLLPPRALLFDLDGTLVDTVAIRVEAWLAAFAEVGIRPRHDVVGRLMGSDGRFVAREAARLLGGTLNPEAAKALDHRAGALFGQLNASPRALPGVTALLRHLDHLGLPWAIATSSRPEQVQASIDALGLGHQPMVADGSHVAHAKPAPDLLLGAARQMGLEPSGIWYVGDSVWDMQAAVAAGMGPVGVTTGAVDAAALREAGARLCVASLGELQAILDPAGAPMT
jgi:HAD superfamily hydrolase (TIGR01509 family)